MPKAKDLRVEHDPVASSKRRWVDYFLVEGDGPPVRWVRVGREGILCCLRCNVVDCLHCDAVRLFLDGGTWKAPADGTEPPAGAESSSAAA